MYVEYICHKNEGEIKRITYEEVVEAKLNIKVPIT